MKTDNKEEIITDFDKRIYYVVLDNKQFFTAGHKDSTHFLTEEESEMFKSIYEALNHNSEIFTIGYNLIDDEKEKLKEIAFTYFASLILHEELFIDEKTMRFNLIDDMVYNQCQAFSKINEEQFTPFIEIINDHHKYFYMLYQIINIIIEKFNYSII